MARKIVNPAQPTSGPRIVGNVEMIGLDTVQPNGWNPNKFTPFMLESLKQGFIADGWLTSQSLLVWGSDENGRQQNKIIDGEHRWIVARDLGLNEGPAVILHGLRESEAKALTIKMDRKRGTFDEDAVAVLIRSIQHEITTDNLALTLGYESDELMSMLVTNDVPTDVEPSEDSKKKARPSVAPGDMPSGATNHVTTVHLVFSKEEHEEFDALSKELAAAYGTKDLSSTVLEAMRRK